MKKIKQLIIIIFIVFFTFYISGCNSKTTSSSNAVNIWLNKNELPIPNLKSKTEADVLLRTSWPGNTKKLPDGTKLYIIQMWLTKPKPDQKIAEYFVFFDKKQNAILFKALDLANKTSLNTKKAEPIKKETYLKEKAGKVSLIDKYDFK